MSVSVVPNGTLLFPMERSSKQTHEVIRLEWVADLPGLLADVDLLASMRFTPRQPGGPTGRADDLSGPWLCVPASRRVCPFEDELH